MEIIQLPIPKSGTINHIFHFADLHIPAGIESGNQKATRYEEYIQVIDKACTFIVTKYAKQNDIVIIIAGDLVDDNRKAGAPCIGLFFEIIKKLAKVAPVYIIRGNHDYNQASIQDQDMLTALMHGLDNHENIAYLKNTSLYQAANIGFGLLAIQDALKAGDTHGRVKDLPPFPDATLLPAELTKIALFHGDVPSVYPIEWFGTGYKYILLGDLHRLQVYNASPSSELLEMKDVGGILKMMTYNRVDVKKPVWAYPGSTIQKHFGESIVGHGFLRWDMREDIVEAFHVPNNYGFVTAKQENEKWLVNLSFPSNEKINECWVELKQAASKNWFPKTIQLRIKQGKHDIVSSFDLIDVFNKHGFTITNTKAHYNISDEEEGDAQTSDIDMGMDLKEFNEPKAWCEFITNTVPTTDILCSNWNEWIMNPGSLLLKNLSNNTITSDIQDRNKKIQVAIDAYKEACDKVSTAINTHTSFELKYMDWAYILCYKDKCHFNFKDLSGNVHCIGGKNGHGKTSFLETICIALYGEGFPSRTNKNYSGSIICMQRPPRSRAFTSIVFAIDDKTYKIKRSFEINGETKLNTKDITLETLGLNGCFELFHSGKKATNEWVVKNLGDVNAFLTSCMITQSFDEDFFNKKASEQKNYLDDQLHLGSSAAFQNVLKVGSLAYDDISKKLASILDVKKFEIQRNCVNEDDITDSSNKLNALTTDIMALQKTQSDTRKLWSTVSEQELSKGRSVLEKQISKLRGDIDNIGLGDVTLEQAWNENTKIKTKFESVKQYHKKGEGVESLIKKRDMHLKNEKTKPEKDKVVVEEQIKSHTNELNAIPNGAHLDALIKEHQKSLDKVETHIAKDEQLLPSLKESLAIIEKQTQELVDNKISLEKPEQYEVGFEIKREEWKMKLEKYTVKYTSFDALEKRLKDLVEPAIPESSWNEAMVAREQNRLMEWLSSLQKSLSVGKGDLLETMLATVTKEYETVDKELALKLSQLENIQMSKVEWQKQSDRLEAICRDILKQQPTPPKFNQQTKRNTEKKKYTDLTKKIDTLGKKVTGYDESKLKAIKDIYPIMKVKIAHLDKNISLIQNLIISCEKHDFNPKCKACMSHPWKLQLDKYLQELDQHKKERTSLDDEMRVHFGELIVRDDEEKQAASKLNELAEYRRLQGEYENLTAFWEQHDVLEVQYEKWKKECSDADKAAQAARNELTKVTASFESLRKDIDACKNKHGQLAMKKTIVERFHNEWNTQYKQLGLDIEENSKSLTIWKQWRSQRSDLERDLELWKMLSEETYFVRQQELKDALSAYKQAVSELEKQLSTLTERAKKTKAMIEDCEVRIRNFEKERHTRMTELKDLESSKKTYLEKKQKKDELNVVLNSICAWETWDRKRQELEHSIEAGHLEQTLKESASMIDKIGMRMKFESDLERVKGALAVVDHYTKSKVLEERIKRLEVEKVQVEMQVSDMRLKLLKYRMMRRELEALDSSVQSLTKEASTLKTITGQFATFKDWVLEKRIIPVICTNVNKLLAVMCKNHRHIELACVFDEKNNFNWMIKDGANAPPLEKASGFQRFTVSLAMRIVLGRLGVAGIKNEQLFIDEGFTACDGDNLGNVPSVLNKLLDMYDSIVLVSHLDELKQGIESYINIERDELKGLSVLQYGKMENVYTTVKKVGRPKASKLL